MKILDDSLQCGFLRFKWNLTSLLCYLQTTELANSDLDKYYQALDKWVLAEEQLFSDVESCG